MIRTGDTIRVDGKEAVVNARWAQAKHVRFVLSDGRELLDLDKRDDVELVAERGVPALRSYVERARPIETIEDWRDGVSNGEDLLD